MTDGFLYIRAAAALLFVLALLGVVAFVARRFTGGVVPSKRQKRLAVVEIAAIDPKRRLVLVRRDQTEHLLLIGGGQDVVVEAAIGAAVASAVTVAPVEAPPSPPPAPRQGPPRSRLDEVRF